MYAVIWYNLGSRLLTARMNLYYGGMAKPNAEIHRIGCDIDFPVFLGRRSQTD